MKNAYPVPPTYGYVGSPGSPSFACHGNGCLSVEKKGKRGIQQDDGERPTNEEPRQGFGRFMGLDWPLVLGF